MKKKNKLFSLRISYKQNKSFPSYLFFRTFYFFKIKQFKMFTYKNRNNQKNNK